MAQPSSHTDKATAKAKEKRSPDRKKSSARWLFLLVAVAAGLYFAYIFGQSNGLLASLSLNRLAPINQDQQTGAPDASPPTSTIRLPASAVPDLSGTADQITGLNARLNALAQAVKDLQSSHGQLLEKIERMVSGTFKSAEAPDLSLIRIDLIDLRLRLSGDPQQAEFELEKLTAKASPNSNVLTAINSNRVRLAGLPARADLQRKLEKIAILASEEKRSITNEEENVVANWLGGIIKVKTGRTATQMQEETATTIAQHAAAAHQMLALGRRDEYLSLIAKLRDQTDLLAVALTNVKRVTISRLMAELTEIGYPEYRLLGGSNEDNG